MQTALLAVLLSLTSAQRTYTAQDAQDASEELITWLPIALIYWGICLLIILFVVFSLILWVIILICEGWEASCACCGSFWTCNVCKTCGILCNTFCCCCEPCPGAEDASCCRCSTRECGGDKATNKELDSDDEVELGDDSLVIVVEDSTLAQNLLLSARK